MEKLKHTPGPWEVHNHFHANEEFWCSIGAGGRGPITDIVGAEGNKAKYFNPVAGMKFLVTPVEEQKTNAELIKRAPTAPHSCADPQCPGDINRRKLEAAEEMAEALEEGLNANMKYGDLYWRHVEAKLTAWEKAGKNYGQ